MPKPALLEVGPCDAAGTWKLSLADRHRETRISSRFLAPSGQSSREWVTNELGMRTSRVRMMTRLHCLMNRRENVLLRVSQRVRRTRVHGAVKRTRERRLAPASIAHFFLAAGFLAAAFAGAFFSDFFTAIVISSFKDILA